MPTTKVLKRAGLLVAFVAAMVLWFFAMTGLEFVVLGPLLGLTWAHWWTFVITFGGAFWFTLGFLVRWHTWIAKGKL